jgi:hypothetical protein
MDAKHISTGGKISIYPRTAIKGKTKRVTLHTRVINGEEIAVRGEIKIKITGPKRLSDIIVKKISINPGVTLNRYFPYALAGKQLGRYKVDTRFYFDGEYVKSETTKVDFFDYKSE